MRDEDHSQPTDNRPEPPAATDGVLRLTYDQIGRRLGMTADAARQLARRKGWPRTRPNHIGESVVVSVPVCELSNEQPPAHRRTTDGELSDARRTPGSEPTVTDIEPPSVNRRSDLHAQALSALGDALAAANTRAEAALALADRLGGQLADAGKRADYAEARAEAAESDRRRADDLVASLEADLRTKDSEIAEQRVAADQARAEARQAQQRGEALRTVVDELKAGQALMADTHARELAAAQREAQDAARHAEEQAEALRQAEETRKARGRLRRAWDGWRGR